jgi:hypothetical protein
MRTRHIIGMEELLPSLERFSTVRCPDCNWRLIDPSGTENLIAHLSTHVKEFHSDKNWREEELPGYIEEVDAEHIKKVLP